MAEQHLVLEEDGTSALLAENGTDTILLEEVVQMATAPGEYNADGRDSTTLPVVLPTDEPWASRGSIGTASAYSFGTNYLDMNPSSAVPAGEVVLVFATWTSHYFFGPDGEEQPEMSCTDDAGNFYTQVHSGYTDNGPGDNYLAMFISQLRNGLSTGNTITLKHYGGGAKAMSVHQVSLREDQRWGFRRDELVRRGDSADPGALTISGLHADEHYLLMHVLGAKGPNTDAYTWDSNWERIADAGTNTGDLGGGVPPTIDQHVRGGIRIVSGVTSDSVDVTSTGTDRQTAQCIIALAALTSDEDFAEFPNTPLIDAFNRANEDPLDGAGLWDKTGQRPGSGSAYARVVSNQAAMSSTGGGSGSEYVVTPITTDDELGEAEVWATIATIGDGLIYLLAEGAGHASAFEGLGVGYRDSGMRALNSDDRGIVAALAWALPSFNGDLPSDGGTIVWGKRQSGVKIGIQQLAYWTIHLWIDDGAGWQWAAAIIKSSSFRFDGQFGIGFEGDTGTRLDDLGGGPLHRDIGQIIRLWPPRA